MWIHAVHRIVALRILTTGHVADDVSETWGKHGNDAVLCQYSMRLNLERIFLDLNTLNILAGMPGNIFEIKSAVGVRVVTKCYVEWGV